MCVPVPSQERNAVDNLVAETTYEITAKGPRADEKQMLFTAVA
jgi:hypothetical protein